MDWYALLVCNASPRPPPSCLTPPLNSAEDRTSKSVGREDDSPGDLLCSSANSAVAPLKPVFFSFYHAISAALIGIKCPICVSLAG